MTVSGTSEYDTFTGFKTALSFEKTFEEKLELAIEKEEPLALAIIDLDNFRRFNEKYGHSCGDSALRDLTELVRQIVPPNTIPGEEFIMLFLKTEREEAFLCIERLRSRWSNTRDLSDGKKDIRTTLTISGGIAAHPADGATVTEIMRKAEQALYRAKVNGRNRVCIAQEEKMVPKTAHFTVTQLERLSHVAQKLGVNEATLLREALDGLLRKYTVSEKRS